MANKKIEEFKPFDQRGVAIMMVMTAIAIMSFLLADFTFETKVNKLKVYNQQDRTQARLNAESGLNFALAKLRLYQEGRNIIEKDEELKKRIGARSIESIVTQPFFFPIEEAMLRDANLIQKNAAKEFVENVIISGKLSVSIKPISGFLNPNNLRVVEKDDDEDGNNDQSQDDEEGNAPPHQYIEKQMTETLAKALEEKLENDDVFQNEYANADAELLIKELKYYVNDAGNFDEPELGEFEALYAEDGTVPKHSPLTSIDELYLLKGWDDALIDLIKDRMTVHAVTIIPVNEITDNQLKVLFPEMTEDQRTDFFKYRDGDEEEGVEPKEFKSANDFKEAIVNVIAAVDQSTYDERIKEFEAAGIKIGVAGKLFLVKSQGVFGRASYTIEAFVDLPVEPEPKKKENEDDPDDPNNNPNDPNDPNNQGNNQDEEEQKKKPPLQLMQPRVVEIRIS